MRHLIPKEPAKLGLRFELESCRAQGLEENDHDENQDLEPRPNVLLCLYVGEFLKRGFRAPVKGLGVDVRQV